jgi:hypothetical protein
MKTFIQQRETNLPLPLLPIDPVVITVINTTENNDNAPLPTTITFAAAMPTQVQQ